MSPRWSPRIATSRWCSSTTGSIRTRRSTTTWLSACACARWGAIRSTRGCARRQPCWAWRNCWGAGPRRQRVAPGRALGREPDVFLLDEPLSNLDAKLRARMREEIARLHQEIGTSMVYVTHDQVEAMTLADRIVIMRDGHVQQIGAPLAVYDRPANLFVA